MFSAQKAPPPWLTTVEAFYNGVLDNANYLSHIAIFGIT